ncbi:ABC-2 type transport system ATP-binding protein [Oikeobacillus pervagus]|uniref:ABC-2 type transport system ATP-binding protein n=1 Tax=Oikeobacillus pervagus TaxID=1325931 RepID=A0AAJ1WKC6_9BACI|nr:ATP-binding cassette domain-containing protein [Oikeobacillus pervagus]MDQ0216378.1 ABC-2 type transport system ATP-binding protein [Oikeobacillus pervagus]
MAFEIQGLNKSFGNYQAVSNLNIKLEEGNILGMLGRNGAGKTTTIRMILDIIKPDSGSILWNGRPLSKKELLIGYLPEERGLYPKMNVVEQLVFLARLEGVPSKIAKRQALNWLERLEMTPYIKKKTEELSKGNQQKVQLISCLIHDPDFIILDEPFSGLDPVNAEMLKDVVKDLIKKRKTIIFCSHQMDSVETFCEEICIMKNGIKVLSGSLSEIKKSYGYRYLDVQSDTDLEPVLAQKDYIYKRNNRGYSIKLTKDQAPLKLLQEIEQLYGVRSLSLREPSLHQIFIEKTGA